MTTFSQAWTAALPAQHDAFGETVTYARGALTVSINAIEIADSEMVVDDGGLVLQHGKSAFIIEASDLVLSGSVTLPARGDQITNVGGDVFEVQEPGGESWCYRREDPQGIWIRVFTVRRT